MLKCGCEIVGIAIVDHQFKSGDGKHAKSPEIEILRHVDLPEDIHLALFLRGLLHLVVCADRYDIRALAMVNIMPTQERHHRALRDENHVPTSSETYKPCK
jgi:hypothetical protein